MRTGPTTLCNSESHYIEHLEPDPSAAKLGETNPCHHGARNSKHVFYGTDKIPRILNTLKWRWIEMLFCSELMSWHPVFIPGCTFYPWICGPRGTRSSDHLSTAAHCTVKQCYLWWGNQESGQNTGPWYLVKLCSLFSKKSCLWAES